MPLDESLSATQALAPQQAEIRRLEEAVRSAEVAYADAKPRLRHGRPGCWQVRDEEIRLIQAIGRARDRLQLARAEMLFRRGEGPNPMRSIDITKQGMPLCFESELAARSRADVGPLDQTEG